jgi:hypothetical protein
MRDPGHVLLGASLRAAIVSAGVGCAQFGPPAVDHGGGGAGGGGRAAAAPGTACAAAAVIDDAEDGDNQVLVQDGRGGYLYTFKDRLGTTIDPAATFETAAGGASGSRQALRFHGKLADSDGGYAGLGLSLTEPKSPYDASRYQGLSFQARRAPGSSAAVRLKLPDVSTDPVGGICAECFNDFGVDFLVTEEWTRYVVSFADLKQGAGWGQPRPAAIDPTRLYSVQWQVSTRGGAFDIWIDDVTFTGCP